jgi:hypothetical protein
MFKSDVTDGVPLLSPSGNWLDWHEAVKAYTQQRFPRILCAVRDFVLPALNDEPFNESAFPEEQREIEYRKYMERYRRSLQLHDEMTTHLLQLHGFLVNRISEESLQALRGFNLFNQSMATQDPVILMKALRDVHQYGALTRNKDLARYEARKAFEKMSQEPSESLAHFKLRYDHVVKGLKDSANMHLTDTDLAIDFLHKLEGRRYGRLRSTMVQDMLIRSVAAPVSVTIVYELACASEKNQETRKVAESETQNVVFNTRKAKTQQAIPATPTPPVIQASAPSTSSVVATKPKRDKSTVKCYNCGLMGHYKHECTSAPSKKVSMTCRQIIGNNGMELLLDNQANISIVRPELACNIKEGDHVVPVFGIAAEAVFVSTMGSLAGITEVYVSGDVKASIISFAEMEDKFPISYRHGTFTVTTPIGELHFLRTTDNLYAATPETIKLLTSATNDIRTAMVTSKDANLEYTAAEIKAASLAQEAMAAMGFTNAARAEEALFDAGTFEDVPFSRSDIKRADRLFGPSVEYIRGRTVKKKISTRSQELPRIEKAMQSLHMDIMHVEGEAYLVAVASPLELTLVDRPADAHVSSLEASARAIIGELKKYGFGVDLVRVDPQGGLQALKGRLEQIVDVCGAGDHVPKAEAKIRRLKELMRSVYLSLRFPLPRNYLKDLVTYAVERINLFPVSSTGSMISPKARATGRRVRFDRELGLKFGDYAEVHGADTSSKITLSRTEPCLALHPAGNLGGSWIFVSLVSGKRIRRSRWTRMVMTDAILDNVKKAIKGDVINWSEENQSSDPLPEEQPDTQPADEILVTPMMSDDISVDAAPQGNEEVEEHAHVAMEVDQPEQPDVVDPILPKEVLLRRSPRFAFTVMRGMLDRHGHHASAAIKAELESLFITKNALIPVAWTDKPPDMKAISSQLLVNEKRDAAGNFLRMKARLVAGGHQQDREIYTDVSAPTVSTTAVLALCAEHAAQRHHIDVVDIGTAYLNADMSGPDVYMRIGADISPFAVEIMPELANFLDGQKRLLVRLNKALYGCIQSARLWHEKLSKELLNLGFVRDPEEECIFRRPGITVATYVDDLFIFSKSKEIADVFISEIRSVFNEITVRRGPSVDYLGMNITFSGTTAIITMNGYIGDLLRDYGEVKGRFPTPATADLFTKDEASPVASDERDFFHSFVARLLYLAQRVRPDILQSVVVLASRVQNPTISDSFKLARIMGYLQQTRSKEMKLGNTRNKLEAYIDAAYAVHVDGKSHTGMVLTLGKGAFYCKSSKQKMASKSSTEAELIALSDCCTQVTYWKDFLAREGAQLTETIVYEDNKSAIGIIIDGQGSHKTRHLRARNDFVTERVNNKDFTLTYCPTGDMLADLFTKPLQGAQFVRLRDIILGNN